MLWWWPSETANTNNLFALNTKNAYIYAVRRRDFYTKQFLLKTHIVIVGCDTKHTARTHKIYSHKIHSYKRADTGRYTHAAKPSHPRQPLASIPPPHSIRTNALRCDTVLVLPRVKRIRYISWMKWDEKRYNNACVNINALLL